MKGRYVTFVVGVAEGVLPKDTGPRPPDGHNLWDALTGKNLTSPRTEVIHAVQNKCVQQQAVRVLRKLNSCFP